MRERPRRKGVAPAGGAIARSQTAVRARRGCAPTGEPRHVSPIPGWRGRRFGQCAWLVPVVAIAALLAANPVMAAGTGTAGVPAVSIGVGPAQSSGQVATSVEILLALTILSLAPAVLLLMTSFTRIVVVLSFARNALGSGQLPPNQVLIGLALFLTLFVMAPTVQAIYTNAWQPFQAGSVDLPTALQRAEDPLRAFMLRQTRPADLALFEDLQKQRGPAGSTATGIPTSSTSIAGSSTATPRGPSHPATPSVATGQAPPSGAVAASSQATVPLVVIVPAFVISELRIAFEMGFVLFIPFVIIDLVVASTLMAMGMVMLPPMLISLPFKILLFVLVDGWSLLAQSLVQSFR